MTYLILKLFNSYLKTHYPEYCFDNDTIYLIVALVKCLSRTIKFFASCQKREVIYYNKSVRRNIKRQKMIWKLESEELTAHVVPRDEKIYDLIVTRTGDDKAIFSSETTMQWGMSLRDIHTVLLGFGFDKDRYQDTLLEIYSARLESALKNIG